jgi:gluconokinase
MPSADEPRARRAEPTTLVVMGVSGSGKSSVARALSGLLGWPWLDADDLHPPANLTKMAAGRPLDDADRAPWLRAVAAWIGEREQAQQDSVVACSALRRRYREVLRAGHPSVLLAHLAPAPEVLAQRLTARQDHFMPARLLDSQLAGLEELDADEPAVRLSVAPTWSAEQTARRLVALLALRPRATP